MGGTSNGKKKGKAADQPKNGNGADLGWTFPTLDAPVNAFAFSAEFSAQMLEKHPALNTPENARRIAWLREMARLVPEANHTRPQVLLVLGEAALDVALRRSLIKCLLRVDSISSQALQEQKRKKPAAKLPKKGTNPLVK